MKNATKTNELNTIKRIVLDRNLTAILGKKPTVTSLLAQVIYIK